MGFFGFYTCDNHREISFSRTTLFFALIIKVTYSLRRTWKQKKITRKVRNVWSSIADDYPLLC